MYKHPHAAITVRNRQHSPLLRLPAELRNKICSYAIGGEQLLISSYPGGYWTRPLPTSARSSKERPADACFNQYTIPKHPVGFLYVCRQLHSETKALPFSQKKLWGLPDDFIVALSKYILHLPQADTLRVVCVRILMHENLCSTGTGEHRLGRRLVRVFSLLRRLKGLERVELQCIMDINPIEELGDDLYARIRRLAERQVKDGVEVEITECWG